MLWSLLNHEGLSSCLSLMLTTPDNVLMKSPYVPPHTAPHEVPYATSWQLHQLTSFIITNNGICITLRDSMIMRLTQLPIWHQEQNNKCDMIYSLGYGILTINMVRSMRKHRLIANNYWWRHHETSCVPHRGHLFDNHLDNLTIHQYEINTTSSWISSSHHDSFINFTSWQPHQHHIMRYNNTISSWTSSTSHHWPHHHPFPT